jgi:hypothetical protein
MRTVDDTAMQTLLLPSIARTVTDAERRNIEMRVYSRSIQMMCGGKITLETCVQNHGYQFTH